MKDPDNKTGILNPNRNQKINVISNFAKSKRLTQTLTIETWMVNANFNLANIYEADANFHLVNI